MIAASPAARFRSWPAPLPRNEGPCSVGGLDARDVTWADGGDDWWTKFASRASRCGQRPEVPGAWSPSGQADLSRQPCNRWVVDRLACRLRSGVSRLARPVGSLARVDTAPRPQLAVVVDAWCRLRLGEVEVVIVRKSRTRWP